MERKNENEGKKKMYKPIIILFFGVGHVIFRYIDQNEYK